MRKNIKKWLRPVLFTVGGACVPRPCPLTSHPLVTMAYMGLVGWLLSGISGKEPSDKCNM